MPDVSLTTFVDFVSKAGTPKATVVRNCKNQPPYDPRTDYYKQLRDVIQTMHRDGDPLNVLTDFLAALPNERKRENYTALITGYRRWARNRQLEWFSPGSRTWSHGALNIKLNPEPGLRINGTPHLIKLYFKAEALSQNRVQLITHLMHVAYSGGPLANATKSVLSIRQHRLFTPPVPVAGLTAQVRAEAAYWMELWPHV